MALSFSIQSGDPSNPGLREQLQIISNYIQAKDWHAAMCACAEANLILMGLPASAQSDTQTVTMRQDLRAAQEMILAARKTHVDNRRVIRAGARHQTRLDGTHRPPRQSDHLY